MHNGTDAKSGHIPKRIPKNKVAPSITKILSFYVLQAHIKIDCQKVIMILRKFRLKTFVDDRYL